MASDASGIRFVIVANPRTGTNHFIDLLNSHPDITCHREVFHHHSVYLKQGTRDELLEERNKNPIAFLKKLYDDSPTPACGFKIFMGHDEAVLNSVLLDKNIKKIVLYRPNFLAVYSSDKVAEAENRYLILDKDRGSISDGAYDSSRTEKKALFTKTEFKARWNAYQEHYRKAVDVLNETGQNYLFMTYEDFINESFFRRVFPFLGLSQPPSLLTRMKKMNDNDILSRFSNPGDARSYIEDIGRQNWAHESFMLWQGRDDVVIDAGEKKDNE